MKHAIATNHTAAWKIRELLTPKMKQRAEIQRSSKNLESVRMIKPRDQSKTIRRCLDHWLISFCFFHAELFLPQEETPLITGGKAAGYRVGDTLNLTCSTVSTNAQLHWFVNDQVVSSSFDSLCSVRHRFLPLFLQNQRF